MPESPRVGCQSLAFAVRTVWTPPPVRVQLAGELDAAGTDTLRRCVCALLAMRATADGVTVDLDDLRFVDLVGVRALNAACRQLAAVGPVEVSGLSSSVRRAMDVIGVVFPDLVPRASAQPD